ncbi:MAG: OmpH family outer membrane protein [Gammaproteobacteria bacterium]
MSVRVTAFAILALMLCAPAAFAAGTVANVDYQRLLQDAPQIKASNALLKQEFVPQAEALQKQKERLETLHNRYLKMGPGTNPLQIAGIQQQIKDGLKKLSDMQNQYTTGLALRERQLRSNLTDLASKEVETYAKAHGFTLVLKSGVLYGVAATDITDEILARLQEDYRQAQAGGGGSHK